MYIKSKKCTKCGKKKLQTQFHKQTASKNGYGRWCKQCTSEYNKKRRRKKYDNDAIENIDFVKCAICGEKFDIISHTHLKTHKSTTGEYRSKFPDSRLISKVYEEKRVNSFKKMALNPAYRKKRSKISQMMWNDPTYRKKLKEIRKKPEYRRELSERAKKQWSNEELREKQSVLVKKRYENSTYRKKLSTIARKRWKDVQLREQQSIMVKNIWNDPKSVYNTLEYRRKLSKASKKMWERSEYRQKLAYKTYKNLFIEDLGHAVRSSWELVICRILKYLQIPYEYESQVFLLEKGLRYIPDIVVDKKYEKSIENSLDDLIEIPEGDGPLYFEVKGWWGKYDTDLEKCMLFSRDNRLVIIDDELSKNYYQIVKKFEKMVNLSFPTISKQNVEEIVCTGCGELKPLSKFHKDRRNKMHGHQTRCKACRSKEYRQNYLKTHPNAKRHYSNKFVNGKKKMQ